MGAQCAQETCVARGSCLLRKQQLVITGRMGTQTAPQDATCTLLQPDWDSIRTASCQTTSFTRWPFISASMAQLLCAWLH